MTPPLPEMDDCERVLDADVAVEADVLLAVVDSVTAELSAGELEAGELSADTAALTVGSALDTTAGAEELALETIGDAEVAIAADEAADVAAAEVVAVVEEPDAAGVELPHAESPRTRAMTRAQADFPVLFLLQTVAVSGSRP